MKAMVCTGYGSPGVLQLREVAKPTPGENEVLVRVRAAVVTPPDCAARKGDPFIIRFFTGLTKPKKAILGSELSGEIEAVGEGVRRFGPGDQVFAATGAGFGAHAEYVCLSETEALVPKPAGMADEDAVAICYGGLTALPFLRDHGQIRPGQAVLINGAAGAVGTAAVQLAKHFGAHVTGVCSGRNANLVRSLGADEVIDYTREDFTTTGQTYDIIFDAVGKSSFPRCKGALKPGGVYLNTVVGPAILLQMLRTAKFGDKKAIIAFTGLRKPGEKAQDLLMLTELMQAGKLRPVIDRRYPLARTALAHRDVETGHQKGTAVITIAPDGQSIDSLGRPT